MEKRTDMRAEALDTLIDIERNKKLSHIAIGETLMRHQFEKKSDRAFYTRLCEGVTERKIYLDYILDTYSKTPMRKCKPLIRSLLRMGAESLQKNQKKMWSADEKYELIAKVLAGVSITESAISAGVEPSLLSQWVRCYKMKGYQGLAAQRKGRPPKEPDDMKKKIVPAELTPSEREELIRLRAENEYLRTENEVIKKRIALRQEKFAAQLKAKKLHSSTNSEEKDTL